MSGLVRYAGHSSRGYGPAPQLRALKRAPLVVASARSPSSLRGARRATRQPPPDRQTARSRATGLPHPRRSRRSARDDRRVWGRHHPPDLRTDPPPGLSPSWRLGAGAEGADESNPRPNPAPPALELGTPGAAPPGVGGRRPQGRPAPRPGSAGSARRPGLGGPGKEGGDARSPG